MSQSRDRFRCQPFYCEENVWWLCDEPEVLAAAAPDAAREPQVVFIVNAFGHCPFAAQRAAPAGELVWWDYHVVLLDGAERVWDLDTRLGLPLPATDWLAGSFPFAPRLPPALAPRFRLVPCADYRRDFASDRSHMRTAEGHWQRPPPGWPPIGVGMNLPCYLDPQAPRPGRLLDLAAFARLAGGAG